jgi:hypothetical protein
MHPPEYLRALVDSELSLAGRLGRVSLVVTSAMATAAVGIVGGTEPSLPSEARVLFSMIGVIGVTSSAFGLRALSDRGAQLAWHRVIACRMGVALAAMIVLGASIIGYLRDIPAAFAVAGFGLFLLVGTLALLRQEHRKFAALVARRDALAALLQPKDPS